ncbi:MAG: sulfurtransferase [Pseudomonadota bacterium]|nr:sulfurtransferase [Pseudomonadota bacterium]
MPAAIEVETLQSWREQGLRHALLDVREPREVAACAVDGALLVPMQEIPQRLRELPQDLPLVVMCHHGMRSRMVVQYLKAQGFDQVINLDGGIDAWAARIAPGMARY